MRAPCPIFAFGQGVRNVDFFRFLLDKIGVEPVYLCIMCFSASASFTASAVLGTLGIALSIKAKRKYLLIALIPCFFAIQQFSEGLVWLALPKVSEAKNVFLFFAYCFWPVWIPLALLSIEINKIRKWLLAFCLIIGALTASVLAIYIPVTNPVPYRYSIHYVNPHQFGEIAGILCYSIAVIAPLFISSLKKIRICGALLTAAGILTYWIDATLFTSIWCFFGALCSIALAFTLKK